MRWWLELTSAVFNWFILLIVDSESDYQGLSVILWQPTQPQCYVSELSVTMIPFCCGQEAVDLCKVKDIGTRSVSSLGQLFSCFAVRVAVVVEIEYRAARC